MKKISGFSTDGLYVGPLKKYTHEIAAQIGTLMPHLDERHDGSPIPEELLQGIISSPNHDQLVVIEDELITAAAGLSLTLSAFEGHSAYLSDVVVHPDRQGSGIANKLWQAIILSARSMGARKLHFATETWRSAAVNFYIRRGVEMDPQGIVCYYTLPEAGEGPW